MKRAHLWLWSAPILFLALFYFYPLLAIFRLAYNQLSIGLLSADTLNYIWQPLIFTIWQAVLSTLLTLLVGLPAAHVFARYSFPGKTFLQALTTLPFILPTVVAAASINALLGPRGWVNVALMDTFHLSLPPLQITNNLWAILLAHVFYNTAVVIRVVGSAWAQMDTRLQFAGRVLGAPPGRAFFEITLPLLRPSILAASLLVFLFDFTSFGVILLLGGPRFSTLEVEIYLQTLQMLNLPLSGLLSAVQLLCTFGLTVLYLQFGGKNNISIMPRLLGEGLRFPIGWREKVITGGIVMLLLALQVAPLAALGLRSVSRLEAERGERGKIERSLTLEYYSELLINRRGSLFYVPPATAIKNSLVYAVLTTLMALTLGFPAAYALVRPSRFNRLAEPLLMLPLGTSAVTLGLGFLLVFNQPPLDIRTFPFFIPIAHSLVALPVVVRTLQPAIASIPESLRQAAAALGASPWRAWCEVDLPILTRAAGVAGIFSFTISMGEFGATSFLARPEVPTMPVAIYRFLSQPGALNYGQALAMATLLVIVCGIGILIIERL